MAGLPNSKNWNSEAQFLFFSSYYRIASIFKFWKWQETIRVNRFFKKVHQLGFWRRLHAELKLTQSVFPVPPRTIDIELTNICNQKCVFCATGLETNERPQGMITFENFKNILEFAYSKTNIQLAGYGEPFLHKELEKFLLYANQRGLIGLKYIQILLQFMVQICASLCIKVPHHLKRHFRII